MKKLDQLNDFEVLDVDPKADAAEIYMAYVRAKEALEPGSMAAYSLLSEEEKKQLRIRIEMAYKNLRDRREEEGDKFVAETFSNLEPQGIAPGDILHTESVKIEKRHDSAGAIAEDAQTLQGAGAEMTDHKKGRSFTRRFLSFMEKALLTGLLLFVVIALLIFMFLFLIPK